MLSGRNWSRCSRSGRSVCKHEFGYQRTRFLWLRQPFDRRAGGGPKHRRGQREEAVRGRSERSTTGSRVVPKLVRTVVPIHVPTDRPEGMRLIVRRVRPSRRHLKKLTASEKKTGWRYCITATNIRHMWGVAGSGHSQFPDVPHRSHAGVEDRVRTNKAMGLDDLPSASWEVNRGWMLAANLASDLDAWVRLLALHTIKDLADAEPETMRFRLYHLPARLADHARRRWLRVDATWAPAFTTCWQRLTALPAVT